jgi:hypothetical protein
VGHELHDDPAADAGKAFCLPTLSCFVQVPFKGRAMLCQRVAPRCRGIGVAWIDCLGMSIDKPAALFGERAGLFLSDGAFFGWPHHVRFNFGCPRETMLRGLEKMAAAI